MTDPELPADPGLLPDVPPEPGTVPALEPGDGRVQPTGPRRPSGSPGRSVSARTRSAAESPRRRRGSGTGELVGGVRRLPIVAAVLGLLVVGGLLDRMSPSGRAQAAPALPAVPVAAPAGAQSSSWFCGGSTDNANGAAPGSLVIANSNAQPLVATVKLVASQGTGATSSVTVPPYRRVAVAETLPGSPPWVGADVTLDGGAAAVEQEVTGPLGSSDTPCATSGQRTWFFAGGQTTRNASDEITLLNPYASDAIVDLSFTTDQGAEAPGQFQALIVPANGLTSVDLASHLRRRTRIATVVTARTGRVVAWQTLAVTPVPTGTAVIGPNGPPPGAIDPASPVPGLEVSLGSVSPARSWTWPNGEAGNGIDEQYVIFNPGPGTAQVQLAVNLDQGSATPFTLTVGPGEVSTVRSDQQARIPAGVTHSATLRSVNGVPVVAERTVAAAPPSSRAGLGALPGERLASPSWLFPAGTASTKSDEWLFLFNPASHPVSATVSALSGTPGGTIPGLGALNVGPGARVAVRINDHAAALDAALAVTATGPVFVEQDLYGSAKAPSYDMSSGVPLQP